MSSAARAVANRTNAQSSTGPRTPEGKSASRLNAVAHGLTSKMVVLPHESQEEYDAVRQSLIDDHQPANEHERLLIDRLAQAHWRLRRCYGVERAFLENRIAAVQQDSPDTDPDAAIAQMFVDKAESARMRLMMRYLGAAERAFYKAGSDLQKAQADRRKRAAQEAAAEEFKAIYADTPADVARPAAIDGGFVSHAAAAAAISCPNVEPPAFAPLHYPPVDNCLPRVA